MVRALDWNPQRSHVVERLVEQPVKFFIGGSNLKNLALPIRRLDAGRPTRAVFDACMRRLQTDLSIAKLIKNATVPRSSRRQFDIEAQAAVSVNGRSIIVGDANVDLTMSS